MVGIKVAVRAVRYLACPNVMVHAGGICMHTAARVTPRRGALMVRRGAGLCLNWPHICKLAARLRLFVWLSQSTAALLCHDPKSHWGTNLWSPISRADPCGRERAHVFEAQPCQRSQFPSLPPGFRDAIPHSASSFDRGESAFVLTKLCMCCVHVSQARCIVCLYYMH